MRITKRVEFDYGHRVPSHKSKCRNIHGHRGVIEVTLEAEIKPIRGESDDGMVADFGDVKGVITRLIAEPWDHAFLVYDKDDMMMEFFRINPGQKHIVFSFVPTAEHLAQEAYRLLRHEYSRHHDLNFFRLLQVRFFETPNSWADASTEDQVKPADMT